LRHQCPSDHHTYPWGPQSLYCTSYLDERLPSERTTIPQLARLTSPAGLAYTTRQRGAETTLYTIRARLVEFVQEDDSDIHLVVADPASGAKMIVEFPADYCALTTRPPLRAKMRAAREALVRACGPASSSFRTLRGTTTITGVGFFDALHGQRGVAPNGIELHPVLAFSGSCA
jgi:hypothetical protein